MKRISWSINNTVDIKVDCNECGVSMEIKRVTEASEGCNVIDVTPCYCYLLMKGEGKV